MKYRLIGKDPDAGKDWRQEEKGTTEDRMIGWHHWLNGHEFEQALGDGEGQGRLMCCSPWGCRVGHDWTTEQQHMYLLLSSPTSHKPQSIPKHIYSTFFMILVTIYQIVNEQPRISRYLRKDSIRKENNQSIIGQRENTEENFKKTDDILRSLREDIIF